MMDSILSAFRFGADPIPLSSINDLHEAAPDIIVWAAPVMFFFVIVEYVVSRYQQHHYYHKKETIGSVLVGIGNVFIGLLLKSAMLYIIILVYNLVPWRLPFSWWSFLPCYILFDFCSYWAHRISHHVRFFWATHVAHHSGEHYNLTVSFRLSWVQYIKIIFFLPVSFIGFHPVIIFITNQIAVLFQFWVHTEYIRRLHPAVEFLLATPSNHRVHHGSQPKYINKNFGATFIIWDRLFGTYQREEEQVTYGITHNIEEKHNPIHINFHEYVDIIKDLRSATSWKERLFFLLGDPEDVWHYKEQNVLKRRFVNDNAPIRPVTGIPVTQEVPVIVQQSVDTQKSEMHEYK
jgi:sterol desaturase/sphingolipid hydroxylase (fatty acid hydroxylase superfamily)